MSGPRTNLPELPSLTHAPVVSVLIVNYNYARFLPEAIESVLQQTYRNFEIIICDDGSGDNSREVITRYAGNDARFKVIFKQNGGVGAALNDAYARSSGDIICMLDADDWFERHKLERVVERFRRGGRVGLVVNTLVKVDSEGNRVGRIPQFGTLDSGELRDKILRASAHWSVAPTSGMSMRRECADKVFPIPAKQFRTEADGYMSTIAPLFYAVDVIDEPATIYRVHSSNVTASTVVDVKWCEKGISAGERVYSALSAIAAREGWRLGALTNNPFYCEMVLIRDYLTGAAVSRRFANIGRLWKAVAGIRTADRWKTTAKAFLLGLASLMPAVLGKQILQAIYLASPFKRTLSRMVLRRA